jgi:hypothetical protein
MLALTGIWTTVALYLVTYTVNAFLHDRGGPLPFKRVLFDERHVPNDYYSIIAVGSVLFVLCVIGLYYARLQGPPGVGVKGIPVVGLKSLDLPPDLFVKYQFFFYVIFIVLPAASLLQFWGQLVTDGRLFHDAQIAAGSPPVEGISLNSVQGLIKALTLPPGSGRICLVTSNDAYRFQAAAGSVNTATGSPCSKKDMKGWDAGIEFVPLISPLLLIGATFLGWGSAARFSKYIWWGRHNASRS